jgi:outer membrane protein assembly factor BamB
MNPPAVIGDYLYGVCSYGQLRAIRLDTGERVWETMALEKQKGRHATAFFVRHGDRYFISTDGGDLVIAKFSPEGYQELSRTFLIKPMSSDGGRRIASWVHPAYANKHIITRNEEEMISYSLAADGKSE